MKVIFTDLDGTLLDSDTYSYEDAKESLRLIKKKNIPLIICTSKTRAEIEYWRGKLANNHPFVSENGGGIFIPKNYFKYDFKYNSENKKYFIINLGTEYSTLIGVIKELKKRYEITSFHEMSIREVAEDAKLEANQAKLAKKREFDEPFKILDARQKKDILKEIKKNKLNYTVGGRYYHLIGNNDKGKAVTILTKLFKKKYDKIITIGLGDSENDFGMLNNVDKPYLVMKKNRSYASNKYNKAGGVGPEGWNKVIIEEVLKYD